MEEHFLEVINTNQKIIHKICRIYSFSQENYDDLFQEILFQLWRSWDSFRQQSKISTWMYRVALNTAITYSKKEIRAKSNQEAISMESEYQNIPDAYDESDYQKLHDAINSLSRTDKALTLMYLERHSYQEIAEVMGLTENNVGVKVNRIKAKLKNLMSK